MEVKKEKRKVSYLLMATIVVLGVALVGTVAAGVAVGVGVTAVAGTAVVVGGGVATYKLHKSRKKKKKKRAKQWKRDFLVAHPECTKRKVATITRSKSCLIFCSFRKSPNISALNWTCLI